jgi:hypothetical protein
MAGSGSGRSAIAGSGSGPAWSELNDIAQLTTRKKQYARKQQSLENKGKYIFTQKQNNK